MGYAVCTWRLSESGIRLGTAKVGLQPAEYVACLLQVCISNRNVFVILMKCTGIMIYPSVLGNPRLSQISQIFKSCLISFDLVIKAINCL